MYRKLSFVLIIAVFKISLCNAQCCDSNQIMVQQITASAFTNYYTQYDGSPFFNEKWYDASVKLSGGEIYSGLKVKLDIFKDELVYDNAVLNKYLIIDKSIINEIYLKNEKGEHVLLIKNVCNQGAANQFNCSFYFIHVSDSISLWSTQRKVISKYNNSSSRKLGYYYLQAKYYMVINGRKTSIPLQKRSLAKMFPENKQAIVRYINQNKLKLKDFRDLTLVFIEINELEKQNPSNNSN